MSLGFFRAVAIAAIAIVPAGERAFAVGGTGSRIVWFPNAKVVNGNFWQAGSVLGDASNPNFFKLNTDGTPSATANSVWSVSRVFWGTGNTESRFSIGMGEKTYQIYIHNMTGTAFTGANKLKLRIFDAAGAQVDESTDWSDGSTALLKQPSEGPDIDWDATNNLYLVSIAAGASVVINTWGDNTNNALYSTPPVSDTNPPLKNGFTGSISLEQPNGLAFSAYLRGQDRGFFREIANTYHTGANANLDFDDNDAMFFNFGQAGIDTFDWSTTSNTVILPAYRERFDASAGGIPEFATLVQLVNGHTSQDTLAIKVFQLNGTQIGTTVNVVLYPNEYFHFMPSQFFTSESSSFEQGFIEISGKLPIATATSMRFCESAQTASQRISCSHGLEFFRK